MRSAARVALAVLVAVAMIAPAAALARVVSSDALVFEPEPDTAALAMTLARQVAMLLAVVGLAWRMSRRACSSSWSAR